MRKLAICCWFAMGSALIAGCGGGDDANLPETVDASGVVMLDGQPLVGASIVIAPLEPGEGRHPAYASSTEGGEFALKAFEAKDGAVPGSYKVRVTRTVETQVNAAAADLGEDAEHAEAGSDAGKGWENDLPEKYANMDTSELTLEVPPEGTSDLKLELVSNP